MKKFIFISFIAILFVFAGCDILCPPEPPVVVTKQYTLEVSVVGAGGTVSPSGTFKVDSGKDQTFILTSEPGYRPDSVIVNGVSSPFYTFTNKYYLFNINSDSKVKFVFKKTLSWYLMLKPWTQDSIIIRQKDGTWTHSASSYPSNVTARTYLPNGRFNAYRDGVLVGDGPWFIDETTNPATINMGGEVDEIEKLDEVSLILANYNVTIIGDPDPNAKGAARAIYSHH
jgi:hypothetical protein